MSYHNHLSPIKYGDYHQHPKESTPRSSIPPLLVPEEIPEASQERYLTKVKGVVRCPFGRCDKRFPLGIDCWWYLHIFHAHMDVLEKEIINASTSNSDLKRLWCYYHKLTKGNMPLKEKFATRDTIADAACSMLYWRHMNTLPREKFFPVDAWVNCWMCDFKFSNYKTLLGHFNGDGYCHGGGPLGLQMILGGRLGGDVNGGVEVPVRAEYVGMVVDAPEHGVQQATLSKKKSLGKRVTFTDSTKA